MLNDLRLGLRFKNAVLYRALEERFARKQSKPQYGFCAFAAREIGVPPATLNGFLVLRESPWMVHGEEITGLRPAARKIAYFLMADPQDLFPVSLYRLRIPRMLSTVTDSERMMSFIEARQQKLLPASYSIGDDDPSHDLRDAVSAALHTLTPNEEAVIKMRFGLEDGNEHTLGEVAQSFAVTRDRIRQIEAAALCKLRHPSRSRSLRC